MAFFKRKNNKKTREVAGSDTLATPTDFQEKKDNFDVALDYAIARCEELRNTSAEMLKLMKESMDTYDMLQKELERFQSYVDAAEGLKVYLPKENKE